MRRVLDSSPPLSAQTTTSSLIQPTCGNQCAGGISARPNGQNSRERWTLRPVPFQSPQLTTLMEHMRCTVGCCLMPPKSTFREDAEPTTSRAGTTSMKIYCVPTQKQHQVRKEHQQSQTSLPGSTTSAKRGGRNHRVN